MSDGGGGQGSAPLLLLFLQFEVADDVIGLWVKAEGLPPPIGGKGGTVEEAVVVIRAMLVDGSDLLLLLLLLLLIPLLLPPLTNPELFLVPPKKYTRPLEWLCTV